MKRQLSLIIAGGICFSLLSCLPSGEIASKKEVKSEKEIYSYAVGMDMGRTLKDVAYDFELPVLLQAVNDMLKGNTPLLTPEEHQKVMGEFMTVLREATNKRRDSLATVNSAKETEFLAANKAQPGVVTTESGLQYQIIQEGTGPNPGQDDEVTVHYVGTLLDGTEFDNSIKRGEPLTFPVGRVIPGWQEAIRLMKVGSKHKVWIPAALGYGPAGSGNTIPPNSALIFEIELINSKPPQAAAPMGEANLDASLKAAIEQASKQQKK